MMKDSMPLQLLMSKLSIRKSRNQLLQCKFVCKIAAEELKKSAEKQKLEREEAARVALAEQQAIMEKVVQASKILQEAANENAKLREYLMDRGRVVDTLQGGMSVILQDVRELKEKFDARLPWSKSIS